MFAVNNKQCRSVDCNATNSMFSKLSSLRNSFGIKLNTELNQNRK